MAISEHLIKTGKIWVDAPCEHCNGTGRTEVREWCRECGLAASPFKGNADYMACGHKWDSVRSEDSCGECEGDGKGGAFVTLTELLDLFKGYDAVAETVAERTGEDALMDAKKADAIYGVTYCNRANDCGCPRCRPGDPDDF